MAYWVRWRSKRGGYCRERCATLANVGVRIQKCYRARLEAEAKDDEGNLVGGVKWHPAGYWDNPRLQWTWWYDAEDGLHEYPKDVLTV